MARSDCDTRNAPSEGNGMSAPAPRRIPDEIGLAFEYAPIGLCITRKDVIRRHNRAFADMFGDSGGGMQGRPLVDLYPSPEEFEHVCGTAPAHRSVGAGRCDERILRRHDGTLFWCQVAGQPMECPELDGSAIWTFRDLSAQRPIVAALTAREREIVRELVTGKTSKQIARNLEISPRTVEAHRARLMRKLDAATPAEMIVRLAGAGAGAS